LKETKKEQLGRRPPEGRFLYFPKLFPVRWFFWKVEAPPAMEVLSASGIKNLRTGCRSLVEITPLETASHQTWNYI
jgi:hypothetical protein